MKKIFAAALVVLGLGFTPAAHAAKYYDLLYDTTAGTATMKLAGTMFFGSSSTTIDTTRIMINGRDGQLVIGSTQSYGYQLLLSSAAGSGNAVFGINSSASGYSEIDFLQNGVFRGTIYYDTVSSFLTMNISGSSKKGVAVDSSNNVYLGDGGSLPVTGVVNMTRSGSAMDVVLTNWRNSVGGPAIDFYKSRGTSASSTTAQTGDSLGTLSFNGYDGGAWDTAGSIIAEAEGTIAAGVIPGHIDFYTASAAGVNTHRMRINSAGNFGFGTNAPTSAPGFAPVYQFHGTSVPGIALSNASSRKWTLGIDSTKLVIYDDQQAAYRLVVATNGFVNIGSDGLLGDQLLTVKGTIHSTTGGFMFPDGTIQTTVAGAGGGDVSKASNNNFTGVNTFNGSSTTFTNTLLSNAANSIPSNGGGNILLYTNGSEAIDLGGSIAFGGAYTGTTQTTWANISGRKENNTDNQYEGYLAFGTRITGGNITERMRIDSNGHTQYSGSTPSIVSGCGTGAQIHGNDTVGYIVIGTGSSAPCIFTWATAAKTTYRKCAITLAKDPGGTATVEFDVGTSSGQINLSGVVLSSGQQFDWAGCSDFN